MTQTPDAPEPGSLTAEERLALAEKNFPLVAWAVNNVAARVSLPAYVSRDDLHSGAQLALVEASNRFDPSFGVPFVAYAKKKMAFAVLDELRNVDPAPRAARSLARRAAAAHESLVSEGVARPTRQQVADRIGVEVEQVLAAEGDIERATPVHIDANPDPLGNSVRTHQTPEDMLVSFERRGALVAALDQLPDNLGSVIERNFFEGESLKSISEDMGLTLARISQLRAEGLRLLYAALNKVFHGEDVAPTGGSRAQKKHNEYVNSVSSATHDYRQLLTVGAGVLRAG